jgi:hypothetical protein
MATSLPFIITEKDMLRSKILDVGWYKVKVDKVSQEPSNDKTSTNTWIDMTVMEGPPQKDGSSANNTPLRRCFSEKAPGFAVNYIRACGGAIDAKGGTIDMKKSEGKMIMVYVGNKLYEGNMQNDPKDFRAAA